MAIFSPYRFPYEHVAASQTAQVLGGVGATGDYLHKLIVTVATAATSTVTLFDGASSHIIVPANTPIGVYSLDMNMLSATGPWKITTAAGVEVIATGIFSA